MTSPNSIQSASVSRILQFFPSSQDRPDQQAALIILDGPKPYSVSIFYYDSYNPKIMFMYLFCFFLLVFLIQPNQRA